MRWNLDVVVAIDAQNLFHHIARLLHIHTESGCLHLHLLLVRRKNLKAKVLQDALLCLHGQFLTDEVGHILVFHIDDGILWQRVVLHIHNLHAHFATSQFLCQHGCTFDGVNLACRVDATLKTETGIRLKSVTTCALANPCGVEVSTLEEHVLRGFVSAATLAAEHTSDTHRLLGIADSQVAVRKFVFLTVEGNERSAFRHGLHHHLLTLHHVGIETVQWLSVCHHDVVGNIDDVVDRTQTDRCQTVFQPLWTLLHFAVLHADSAVTRTSLGSLHHHIKLQVIVLYLEVIH